MAKITSINHIAFAVKNLEDSLHNATEILGGELMMKFESLEDTIAYELYWAEFPEKDICRDTVGYAK